MPSIETLKKLLSAEPNDPFLLYGLAQEHAKLGEHDAAVAAYRRCLEADPGYVYAYYHMARVLEAAGRTADAIDAAKTGLAAARQAGDQKAASELASLVDELEP